MRDRPGAGVERRMRRRGVRVGMTQRDRHAARRQQADQLEAAGELWREGHRRDRPRRAERFGE